MGQRPIQSARHSIGSWCRDPSLIRRTTVCSTTEGHGYPKGLLITPPFSQLQTVRDIFFLYFSQTNIQNVEADMRIQLFSIKPDSKEISKNGKNATLLPKLLFVLGNAVDL